MSNFNQCLPNYAISMCLLHRQQLAHALIFYPVRNELFYASRGEGAFLNDRRVRVSQQRHYHEALLGAHVAGAGGGMRADCPFAAMLANCTAARRTRAGVLVLACVA